MSDAIHGELSRNELAAVIEDRQRWVEQLRAAMLLVIKHADDREEVLKIANLSLEIPVVK